jgi:DedD protein
MPQPIGDDELKLKQRARRRLIGAIALLAVLVLVLPWVLDKEPKRASNEISVHIPTASQSPTNPELAPQVPEPKPEIKPEPPPETKPETAAAATPQADAPARPAPAPAPTPTPTEIPPALAADTPVKAKADGGFYVQVGVFSKADNAKTIHTKLSRAKLPVHAEQVKTAAGVRVRVRVGPFSQRSAADAALEKVRKAGEKSAVVIKADSSR